MRVRFFMAAAAVALLGWSAAEAVTVQDPAWVLGDGTPFVWVEAESLLENEVTENDTGYLIVDTGPNQYTTITQTAGGDDVVNGGLPALPENGNAFSGGGIIDLIGGGDFQDTATYEVQFSTPGTYYVYGHISIFNRDNNTNYGNEDSFYISPALNLNSSSDWIGFEGVDENGDPKTGDSIRDGWMAAPNNRAIMSDTNIGEFTTHNSTNEEYWDGEFHWHLFSPTIDMDSDNNYVDDFGMGVVYEVTEADVGQTMTFEISSREPYGAHDGFLIAQSDVLLSETYLQEDLDAQMLDLGFNYNLSPVDPCDLNEDGVCDYDDLRVVEDEVAAGTKTRADALAFLTDPMPTGLGTIIGDANLDNSFDPDDLIEIFAAGKYNNGEQAYYDQGDYDFDGVFGPDDLIEAFATGNYNSGAATAAVPEPAGLALLLMGGLGLLARRRR